MSHCYSPGCSGGAEPRRTCKRRDRTAALALADPNRIALCVRADCRDWLADAVRQELRPRLAEQGFRGSGATFVLPSHSHFATVGLQKSQLSHRETLKFTANVTVVAKYVWLSLRDAKPHLPIREPNTRYGGEVWQRRIGNLLPDGQDKWWSIASEADATNAVGELASAVEVYVLPAMRARLSARNCGAACRL